LRAGASADGLADELTALVRDRKGPVQTPKHVIVADRLPLTALGKPDKKALRAAYADHDFG
jgi:fatty-acyl-CoA synthase